MSEKYDDASLRHFEDADRLASDGRHDNAGHLIGLAAECAIKHAVRMLGGNTADLHIPLLIGNAKRQLAGRNAKSLLDLISQEAFFAEWTVNRRYDASGLVSAEQYKAWRTNASRALAVANLRRAA